MQMTGRGENRCWRLLGGLHRVIALVGKRPVAGVSQEGETARLGEIDVP
jgi:hypothetical protein